MGLDGRIAVDEQLRHNLAELIVRKCTHTLFISRDGSVLIDQDAALWRSRQRDKGL